MCPAIAMGQSDPTYEDVSVFFNVPGLGGQEVEAIIKNEEAYLSVADVFSYLKIKNKPSADLQTVSGFFLEPNTPYTVDGTQHQIILAKTSFQLKPDDFIITTMALYLKSDSYGKVFGLHCDFHFRSLSVRLSTKLDLPAIRELRLELMRNNAGKLKKEIVADTIVARKYSRFNAGALDWQINNTQRPGRLSDTRLNMRLGTVVAGGETNLHLSYNSQRDINLREQYYNWRYVNNENTYLKQISAGKIAITSTATLFAPVIGVKFTNTPTTYRRSFDSYTLSDFTEPDWMVELYVNNHLLDYVKADASGFFSFEVPLVYGSSKVELRFFGPWGEERTKEKTINVPYNFLPAGEMEYTLVAGMVENGLQSRFARADLKYGLTRSITIGSGLEYLTSIAKGNFMPFINASVRLANNVLLSADHTYAVRSRALLTYRLPSSLFVELNYISYVKGQTAINGNISEERSLIISKPFRWTGFSGFTRLSVNQLFYPNATRNSADLLLSGGVKGISASLTTSALMIYQGHLNLTSSLAMTFQLPRRTTFRPQLHYNYRLHTPNEIRAEIEKQVFNQGFLNIEYTNNLNNNSQSLGIGLRFNFSFARASISARQSNSGLLVSQSVSGGALYDRETKFLNVNNRINVGRGSLVVHPFLDINANNRRDKDEPKINGLQLKINGGRVQNDKRDTAIHVLDLESYAHYLLELNSTSFENIAWELKKKSYRVTIEPNTLKLLEVPIEVRAEVSGIVYALDEDEMGQSRIIVNIFRDEKLVAKTLSESDGYFSYLGLTPGDYYASVDSTQLNKLSLSTSPATQNFTVKASFDGDVIQDINFNLEKLGFLRPSYMILNRVAAGTIINQAGKFTKQSLTALARIPITAMLIKKLPSKPHVPNFLIVANAFGGAADAAVVQKDLTKKYGYPVRVFGSGSSSYQLNIEGFETREEAESLLPWLSEYKFRAAYITAAKIRIVQPVGNPAPLTQDEAMYFAIVVGHAPDEAGIKAEKERIFKVLNYNSFPLNKDGVYRLLITGFSNRDLAESAYRRLIEAGVRAGYISTYKKSFRK